MCGRSSGRNGSYAASGAGGLTADSFASRLPPSRDTAVGNHSSPLGPTTPPDLTRAAQSASDSLDRLTDRQASPLPSMTPSPVMATSVAASAHTGELHAASRPRPSSTHVSG